MVEAKNNIKRHQRLLKRLVGEVVLKQEARLMHLSDLSTSESRKYLLRENDRLRMNENTVRLLDPQNVLKRGFTLTLKEGKIVKSVSDLGRGDELTTRFVDGIVQSKITKKTDNGS